MADIWIQNPMLHVSVAPLEQSIITLRSDGTVWALGTNKYGEFGVPPATTASVSTWTQLGMDNVESLFRINTGVYVVRKDGSSWYTGFAAGSSHTAVKNTAVVQTWTESPLKGVMRYFEFKDHNCVAATTYDGSFYTRLNDSGSLVDNILNFNYCHRQNVIKAGRWRYASGSKGFWADWYLCRDGSFLFGSNDSSAFAGSDPFVKTGRTEGSLNISTCNNIKDFQISNAAYNSSSSSYNYHFYGGYKVLFKDGTVGVRCIKYNTDYNQNYHSAYGYADTNTHTYAKLSITNVKQIYSQNDSLVTNTYFVKNDGTVWVCGRNSYGVLGINNTTTQSGIVQSQIEGVEAITGNSNYTLFIKKDGSLFMI